MKRKIAIATLTAAVLVGGGLVTTAAFADSDGSSGSGSSGSSGSSGKDGRTAATDRGAGDRQAGPITVDRAVAAALKAVPGTVTEAELDDDDDRDRTVWELDVYGSDGAWHDVRVDAGSGAVLSDREDDDNDDRDRHAPRSAAVSLDAAVKAALGAQPGTVTSVDLDDDDDDDRRGALRWDVDVRGKDGTRHELHVDAKTAKVTVDHDDDRDDRDDRSDDDGDDD